MELRLLRACFARVFITPDDFSWTEGQKLQKNFTHKEYVSYVLMS